MIRTRKTVLPLLAAIAILSACVPARKYEELNTRYKAMQENESSALAKAQQTEAAMKDQQVTLEDLTRRKEMLQRDTLTLGTSLRHMTTQYDKINALNNELLEKYNLLLAGGNNENRKLLTDLEANRLKLQNKEDSLAVLAGSLKDREAKLAELQAELDKKDQAMKALKDRVSQALTGFEGKGLTVTQRDGQIYVSLDNKLLFPSGSTTVDAKGREALSSLAKAIENDKDVNIMVEGHTDTDKVLPGAAYKDNWDLSVLRATSVVRILQESSKIDPKRITAAGKGEYEPADPDDKAKNRRIEVVLAPDLKGLYDLVKEH
ncbi:MAG: OmpA family protein [Flavobacteriales bacterium]|nr:OmpA family protein [Flavobacteriales bacterium]MBK6891984.1 OmpA family protein [Flavobacteriales bacterium]MBK9598761.1 OmpA family protein [Flavobacteriales bacterium]QQS71826.1 MAG: OmpA family protein [Flavobacteriales bacterium]